MKMMHITIQTNKFSDEIEFYRKWVGLSVKNEIHAGGKNIVFLGDDSSDTLIEIIENNNAKAGGNENLSIGFKSLDVEKSREELIKSGFEVTPIISPMPNVKFFFIKDPAGVRVQFI